MQITRALIAQVTDTLASIDHLYETWAKRYGFTLLEKQFFHLLSEHPNGSLSQKQLCGMMNVSKTTVNTIVNKMVRQDYVHLQFSGDSRKEKVILLTERGEKLIAEMIAPLVEMEIAAFSAVAKEDLHALIRSLNIYHEQMEKQIENGHG